MTSDLRLSLSAFARVILGIVFLYASFDKILNPDLFVQNIIDYDLVAIPLARFLSYWLPWLEFLTGGLLLGGIWVRASATLVSILLVAFIFAIASAMARGLVIQCGCFEAGDSGDVVGWPRLLLDIFLLLPSIWLVLYPSSRFSVSQE